MLKQKKLKISLLVFATLFVVDTFSVFQFNLFKPYDINLRPAVWKNTKWQVSLTGEFGLKTVGYGEEEKSGILQIWQECQDCLAMLKGFDPCTKAAQLAQKINVDDDDGIRGHVVPKAHLDLNYNMSAALRYHFPKDFTLDFFLPIMSMKMSNLEFCDKTKDVTFDDVETKRLLTDNLAKNLKDLGDLDLSPWERTGFGDFVVMLEWLRDFPQDKSLLKNVRLNVRGGLSFPTGKKRDEDKIMALAFGNDGAFGIIPGGGLDLTLSKWIKAGADLEFLILFGDVRDRRIKTDVAQTDLFLLQKAKAHIDYGLTHRFNLFLEAHKVLKGLSLRATYQYWKHEDDKFILKGNQFIESTANSAVSLEDWTLHNAIFTMSYDFQDSMSEDARFKPYLSAFYKCPLNGKKSILAHTAGFVAALSF
ncbi:MAG: hypothetical protein UR26_C0001G0087 [candidate division TM6 bacterium GW2011_GWF2_32_72]|nr:MAG: hypothetical protein UR26_C0001G0087 [candidate division TM6 bacterium GW2011_GWF2_32_72]